MLSYVVCTAVEFVWNEGGVVQLPAPYITLCDFFVGFACFSESFAKFGVLKMPVKGKGRLDYFFCSDVFKPK